MAILIIPNNLIRKTHATEYCSLDVLLHIEAMVVVRSDRGYFKLMGLNKTVRTIKMQAYGLRKLGSFSHST